MEGEKDDAEQVGCLSDTSGNAREMHRVWVDVSSCRYDLVRTTAQKMGWSLIEKSGALVAGRRDRWNLYWTDKSVTRTRCKRMMRHQMTNHFAEMQELCCKSFLATNLRNMAQRHANEYDFFPDTWILPDEHKDFSRECKKSKNQSVFIVKPERGCQGKGIFLTRSANDDEIKRACWRLGDLFVAQRYVANPLLISGLKFDLRLYLVITSCDPLRVYIYREGLARFCTEPFDQSSIDAAGWRFSHLTNFSVNRANKAKFCDSENDKDASRGSKRRVSGVLELLRQSGHDTSRLWERIQDMAAKTVISAQPLLAHYHRLNKPQSKFGDDSFEILGMDVLLDENLKPWLLELNHSPSFHCDGLVDRKVKSPLLREVMCLISSKLEARAALGAGSGPVAGVDCGDRELLERMKGEIAAGRSVLQADPSVLQQSTQDFDLDRPRYCPPGAERQEWVGRSADEENEWLAEQELNDANALKNFMLCYPPTSLALQDKYNTILQSAVDVHKNLTQAQVAGSNSDGHDDGSDSELLLSSSDDGHVGHGLSSSDDCDSDDSGGSVAISDEQKGRGRSGASQGVEIGFGSDGSDPEDWWKRFLLHWSGVLLGVGLLCPPLMLVLFLTFRSLQKWDSEAGTWASIFKYSLLIQIPTVLLLILLYVRVEMLAADIMSGKHSMPLDDFLKTQEGKDASRAMFGRGAGSGEPSVQSYCGAK